MVVKSVSPEVEAAVRRWEKERKVNVFFPETEYGWTCIAALTDKGCTAADIVSILELLRLYGRMQQFADFKVKREEWIDRANKLVGKLRLDADDAEELLQFVATGARIKPNIPSSTSDTRSAENRDSDSDASTSEFESQVRSQDTDAGEDDLQAFTAIEMSQPEPWEVMRTCADDLEARIKIEEDENLPFEQPFAREIGGTLPFLVISVALVKEATGRNHYAQISDLLQIVCPEKALDENALQRQVNRFRKRNKEFVEEFIKSDEEQIVVREIVKELLQRSG